MAKNLKLIKGLSASPLKKLNEGQVLKNPDKYVFEGVFTQCSTPEHKVINRNGRIYMENEVLRHLGYLRDMIKENNGRILGELDHPEGRFEVSMKEASHMITDLWYDQNTHCVMGRLEVLDTPNGKTLKSLIEAGFPLYVSSRAAGDVNSKTKEVEIAQIFTYDVVCTPGFKEARLERVNESLLTDGALKYLNESSGQEEKKTKLKAIEVPMDAINENVNNYNNVKIEDVTTPLNEEDEPKEEKNLNDDVKKFLPIMNTSGSSSNTLKEEDGDDNNTDENSDKNKSENSKENKDENSEEVGDDDKKELTDKEKEANRDKIVSVKGFDEDGNELGENSEEDTEDKKDDIENIEGKTEDEKNSEENKDENSEENKEDENSEEEANEDVESEAAKAEEKSSKIKENTDKDVAELESILASVKKKEEVKESIIQRYPFASALTEANFAKFASLRPKQKKRVLDFIDEHEIYDIQAINELWMAPLTEEKKVQQNWLKLASQSDIDLYVAAPMEVQNAIEEQAQLFPMETEEEVDAFWNMTGLRQQAMRKAMNEKMVADYKNFVSEINESVEATLGYDPYLIRATELMLNEDEF